LLINAEVLIIMTSEILRVADRAPENILLWYSETSETCKEGYPQMDDTR